MTDRLPAFLALRDTERYLARIGDCMDVVRLVAEWPARTPEHRALRAMARTVLDMGGASMPLSDDPLPMDSREAMREIGRRDERIGHEQAAAHAVAQRVLREQGGARIARERYERARDEYVNEDSDDA